jgi:hypothetical protein
MITHNHGIATYNKANPVLQVFLEEETGRDKER